MKKRLVTIACALLAIGMTSGSVSAADPSYILPREGRFILPSSAAHEIFEQCSRSAPSSKSELWTPSEKDLEELESLLLKYLDDSARHPVPPRGKYHRQYVGFMRDGERYIYGNFYKFNAPYESKHAIQVCDGGPSFWGIVFRVKTKTFEDIHFNGVA